MFSALLLFSLEGAQAQAVVKVKPTPPRVVVVKKACGPNQVWIDGHWQWDRRSRSYLWVQGHCAVQPLGKVWIAGHWAKVPGGWKWVPGHWARRR